MQHVVSRMAFWYAPWLTSRVHPVMHLISEVSDTASFARELVSSTTRQVRDRLDCAREPMSDKF